jgi:hypothetical protein
MNAHTHGVWTAMLAPALLLAATSAAALGAPGEGSHQLGTVTIDYPSGTDHPPATWGTLDGNGCPSTVNGSTYSVTWTPNTNCYHAVVSCPVEKIPDIGVTFGVASPVANVNGTIVFTPSTSRGEKVSAPYVSGHLLYAAYNSGFRTLSFAWDGAWAGYGCVLV